MKIRDGMRGDLTAGGNVVETWDEENDNKHTYRAKKYRKNDEDTKGKKYKLCVTMVLYLSLYCTEK